MNIALLTAIVSKKSGARAPLEIAKSLCKKGHLITIFAYDTVIEKETINELKKANIPIIFIPKNKLLSPFQLSKHLRHSTFDVISFHGTLPFFLGTLISTIPIVRTYYGIQLNALIDKFYKGRPSLSARMLNPITRFLIKERERFMSVHSKKVISISKCTQKEHKRLFSIESSCSYLGTNYRRNIPKKKKIKDSIIILSVSRIIPYKGFHRLIYIFNKMRKKFNNIELIIVGSTPNIPYLTYLKKIAGENIIFKTNISDRQLLSLYLTSDIYATLDRSLVFSLTILEAASFSLPTIALNLCAGKEEIIHEKTGYLANNEKEFEKYLEILIRNREIRSYMGKQARIHSFGFSWMNLANQYIKVFEEILSEKSENYSFDV